MRDDSIIRESIIGDKGYHSNESMLTLGVAAIRSYIQVVYHLITANVVRWWSIPGLCDSTGVSSSPVFVETEMAACTTGC